MAQGKYIADTDLINRMNPKMYLAIFDDERRDDVDEVNDAAVQQVIDGAEAEVDSYIVGLDTLPLPTNIRPRVDRLIYLATLDYAESLSFLRHPEYPRTFGENGKARGLWSIAEKRMERVKQVIQLLPDITSQTNKRPQNTGGFVGVTDPRAAEGEEPNGRHFDDTGLF